MKTLYGVNVRRIPRIEHGKRPRTDNVVVHDMESDNLNGVENYFRTSSPDEVGAHLGIGPNGEIREWADLDSLVYHAKGDNSAGVGIELAGYAAQSRRKWVARRRQRIALAKAIARLCHLYHLGLPTHGENVLGHYQVPAGGHTDPGPNFPWDAVMLLARKYYRKWYVN